MIKKSILDVISRKKLLAQITFITQMEQIKQTKLSFLSLAMPCNIPRHIKHISSTENTNSFLKYKEKAKQSQSNNQKSLSSYPHSFCEQFKCTLCFKSNKRVHDIIVQKQIIPYMLLIIYYQGMNIQ